MTKIRNKWEANCTKLLKTYILPIARLCTKTGINGRCKNYPPHYVYYKYEEVNNEDTCQFKPISSYFLGEIWPPWVRTSNLGLIFTIFIRTKCPRWDTPRLQWEHVGLPQHNSSKNSKQNNSTAVEQNHGVPEQLFMLLYYFPELNKLSYLIWKRRV